MAGKRPAHEILGVQPRADIIAITIAFNRESQRWQDWAAQGDEVARQRLRRLEEAYQEMALARGFRPAGAYAESARHSGNSGGGQVVFRGSARYRADDFRLCTRIAELKQKWENHKDFIARSAEITDRFKQDQGIGFTRLKAIFLRRAEDRNMWQAEKFLRAGGQNSIYAVSDLEIDLAVEQFERCRKYNGLEKIDESLLRRIEQAVDERGQRRTQAEEVLKRQRFHLGFTIF